MHRNNMQSGKFIAAMILTGLANGAVAAGDPAAEMATGTFFYQCSGMFEETVYTQENFCQGYLLGVLHAADRQRGNECDADLGEPMAAVEALQKYLRENMQYNSMLITEAVARAINERFPCKSIAE